VPNGIYNSMKLFFNCSFKKSGTTYFHNILDKASDENLLETNAFVTPIKEFYFFPRNTPTFLEEMSSNAKATLEKKYSCNSGKLPVISNVNFLKKILDEDRRVLLKSKSIDDFIIQSLTRTRNLLSVYPEDSTVFITDPNFISDCKVMEGDAGMKLWSQFKESYKIQGLILLRSPIDSAMSLIKMHFKHNGRLSMTTEYFKRVCSQFELRRQMRRILSLVQYTKVGLFEHLVSCEAEQAQLFREIPAVISLPSSRIANPNPGVGLDYGYEKKIKSEVTKILNHEESFYNHCRDFIISKYQLNNRCLVDINECELFLGAQHG